LSRGHASAADGCQVGVIGFNTDVLFAEKINDLGKGVTNNPGDPVMIVIENFVACEVNIEQVGIVVVLYGYIASVLCCRYSLTGDGSIMSGSGCFENKV